MSEIKLISPILDDFDVGGSINEHDGVCCFPAMRKNSSERYIVKTVSIPASQTQLDALLLTGAYSDAASALGYFKELADITVKELEALKDLSQAEGFLAYENWQVSQKASTVGFDVYMIGDYRYSLRKYFQKQPMTHLAAINMGMDLCAALTACRQKGYLYIDLKPNNVYIGEDNKYRIGDIGFLELASLKYATLPSKYRSLYTAPEVQDAFAPLNTSIDIYALGLILYQAYNGGELPFAGDLAPNDVLPSPAYADYEMAEIIMKACAPNPEERWQDPSEMEQALVSYMQRNGANNTPIVPPVVHLSEPEMPSDLEEGADVMCEQVAIESTSDEDSLVTDNTVEEAAGFANGDDDVSLTDLYTVEDETVPENNLNDVSYDEISDELNEILSQADELVAHPVPAPVVAPDEFELPAVETLIEEEVAEEEPIAAEIGDTESTEEPEDSSAEDSEVPTEDTVIRIPVVDEEIAEPAESSTDDDYEEESFDKPVSSTKRKVVNWILGFVIFLLIAAIAAVGVFYYQTIYLLPIHSIAVDGSESTMIVKIETDIDESLLSVICSDSHGNQISAPIVNGNATFANLTPDTAYSIQVLVNGFHRLTGETAASYSTPAQTNVVQFSAITGSENGSVILSFTLEGPDTGNWKVSYSAEGEETQVVDVLSHMVTLTGLSIGKEYTFTLIPGDDMYVTGITETTFTASKLVYAQNVMIISCVNNQLTAVWDNPDGVSVESWTVRCYNDANYNQTKIISDTTAVFEGIDPSTSYTVEVTAFGMSVSERAYMVADAITITNFTASTENPEVLQLTWDSSSGVPADGWVLSYAIDGSEYQGHVVCVDNNTLITPVVPGALYTFELKQANGNPVLTLPLQYRTPDAQDFSGYGVNRSMMSYHLCSRPEGETWSWKDVSEENYKTTFSVGDRIGIVGELSQACGKSTDTITVLFVIRDESGKLVTYSYTDIVWDNMWNDLLHCALELPDSLGEAGTYTISIYFDEKFVMQETIKIQ